MSYVFLDGVPRKKEEVVVSRSTMPCGLNRKTTTLLPANTALLNISIHIHIKYHIFYVHFFQIVNQDIHINFVNMELYTYIFLKKNMK